MTDQEVDSHQDVRHPSQLSCKTTRKLCWQMRSMRNSKTKQPSMKLAWRSMNPRRVQRCIEASPICQPRWCDPLNWWCSSEPCCAWSASAAKFKLHMCDNRSHDDKSRNTFSITWKCYHLISIIFQRITLECSMIDKRLFGDAVNLIMMVMRMMIHLRRVHRSSWTLHLFHKLVKSKILSHKCPLQHDSCKLVADRIKKLHRCITSIVHRIMKKKLSVAPSPMMKNHIHRPSPRKKNDMETVLRLGPVPHQIIELIHEWIATRPTTQPLPPVEMAVKECGARDTCNVKTWHLNARK